MIILPAEGQRIRTIVEEGPEYQFVRIYWGPNSESGEHEHPGIRIGRTVIGGGEFTEERDGITLHYSEGDTFHETPATRHNVRTTTGGWTDHYYSPPINLQKMLEDQKNPIAS